ncbi:MAG: polysaccharide deacetylase family protein, partial [Spirochaetaceae bacterium]|nr:polysaccharide deacetylase family protein [Spirochaetaceae bacterium]
TDFSLAELAAQVDSLLALGYRFICLEDLLFGRFSGGKNIVATIDDGHRTVSDAVSKVFAARGIAPALFVFPGVIGKSEQYLDSTRLAVLRDEGSPLGSHGYYHLYLTETLYKRERAVFDKEVFTSKTKVEELTGLPAYAFAYPFGTISEVTKREVARAGYAFGLAVKPGFVYADARLNDPYDLPRTVVTRAAWKETFALLERNARTATEASPGGNPEFPLPSRVLGRDQALTLRPALKPAAAALTAAPPALPAPQAPPLAAFPSTDGMN